MALQAAPKVASVEGRGICSQEQDLHTRSECSQGKHLVTQATWPHLMEVKLIVLAMATSNLQMYCLAAYHSPYAWISAVCPWGAWLVAQMVLRFHSQGLGPSALVASSALCTQSTPRCLKRLSISISYTSISFFCRFQRFFCMSSI